MTCRSEAPSCGFRFLGIEHNPWADVLRLQVLAHGAEVVAFRAIALIGKLDEAEETLPVEERFCKEPRS